MKSTEWSAALITGFPTLLFQLNRKMDSRFRGNDNACIGKIIPRLSHSRRRVSRRRSDESTTEWIPASAGMTLRASAGMTMCALEKSSPDCYTRASADVGLRFRIHSQPEKRSLQDLPKRRSHSSIRMCNTECVIRVRDNFYFRYRGVRCSVKAMRFLR